MQFLTGMALLTEVQLLSRKTKAQLEVEAAVEDSNALR
jgi:hypothetical protein